MGTVLVTGGAGFIGSHVCEALVARGDRVVVLDNFDPLYSRERKLRNLVALESDERVSLVEADLVSESDLGHLFDRFTFDLVIHLAAKAGIRESMCDPAAYLRTNVEGTANLLQAMTRAGCRPLVFASSSSVYGNNPTTPFREDDAVHPISVYAMTKKAGEDLCHVYHRVHDLSVICLRFFTVYGPRQRPGMAIHKFVRGMMDGTPITMFGDGSLARDYTYVDDVVEGVMSAASVVTDRTAFDVLNLGSGRPVTLEELVDVLGRVLGIEPRVAHEPVPPVDVDRTHADIGRARRVIGYDPSVDLETGLRRFVEWYREESDVGDRAGLLR